MIIFYHLILFVTLFYLGWAVMKLAIETKNIVLAAILLIFSYVTGSILILLLLLEHLYSKGIIV
jgi:hypothetical protein